MGDKSKIEWTDASWNPIAGCSKVSQGCKNCYAIRSAHRMQHTLKYAGTTRETAHGPEWTGKINPWPDVLEQPLRWKRPRRIFVNSMSDLFHPEMIDKHIAVIGRVMDVIERCPQHVFQILTKRPENMRDFFQVIGAEAGRDGAPPNAWVGVSVEDQPTANERIPVLLETPAVVRWLSCEPLLGPIGLGFVTGRVDWVVAGAESGPGARPCELDWIRDLRDQCVDAEVPFFFKQFVVGGRKIGLPELDGKVWNEYPEIDLLEEGA